jgi:TolA-binding protein
MKGFLMPNRMSRVFSKLLPANMAGLVSTSLLSLSLLAGPNSAKAQPAPVNKAKNTRNVDVKVDVKLSDRVKPLQKEAPKVAQPELTADKVLSIEGLVGDLRNEQTQILIDLIQDTSDREVDEKSDYYYRLGEIYAKQQRFHRLKTAENQIASDMAKKPADKAKFAKMADDSGKKAKKALIDAVKVYKALTENDKFKNYAKMDQALFYYGYTLQGGKYMTEARGAYDKLLKNYPNSKYVPEAHLAFADYFFEINDLENAESRYKQVLKHSRFSKRLLKRPRAIRNKKCSIALRKKTTSARTQRLGKPNWRTKPSSASTKNTRSPCSACSLTCISNKAKTTKPSSPTKR